MTSRAEAIARLPRLSPQRAHLRNASSLLSSHKSSARSLHPGTSQIKPTQLSVSPSVNLQVYPTTTTDDVLKTI
jgi:hypothetical protein